MLKNTKHADLVANSEDNWIPVRTLTQYCRSRKENLRVKSKSSGASEAAAPEKEKLPYDPVRDR